MNHRITLAGLRARHARSAQRRTLQRDLAVYRSADDLTDLAAILDRHPDEATAPLRDAVEWTRAA